MMNADAGIMWKSTVTSPEREGIGPSPCAINSARCVTLKVKLDFVAKEKARKDSRPEPKPATKAKRAA
jgi:hypothetical protein